MRPPRGAALLARPRISALVGDARVVLLEAPGGYGKSTTARLLASAVDRPLVRAVAGPRPGAGGLPNAEAPGADAPGAEAPGAEAPGAAGLTGPSRLLGAIGLAARRSGLPLLAEAIDPDDPDASLERLLVRLALPSAPVLAIDEAQRLDDEAAEWLARLVEAYPGPGRLVVAGRRLPRVLRAAAEAADAVSLGADELRCDPDETAAFVGQGSRREAAPSQVAAILRLTGGWPAAVALAAAIERQAAPAGGARAHPGILPMTPRTEDPDHPDAARAVVLRALLDDLLAAATPADREHIGRLAQLPLLSTAVAEAVAGPGALDRLLDAGLPVRFRPDGWAELHDTVRELLAAPTLDPQSALAAAARYAERGALAEAAGLLRRSGDPEGLATLLARAGRDGLSTGGLSTLAAFAAELPDPVLASRPALLVALVQATERRSSLRSAWVARAIRLLPDPSAERRAVEVERSLDAGRAGDLDGGIAIAEAVLRDADPSETATIGRARSALALLRIVANPASAAAAAGELEAAIGLLQAAGERSWEADAWQVLGNGCHSVAGHLVRATECLERALALRHASDAARAATLTYLAETLTHRGDLEAAAVAVREAEAIGLRIGDRRAIAFAAWSAARLAAERRDLAGVHASLAVAEANQEGWAEGPAGIEFLADAADMLAAAGDPDASRRMADRAEARGRAEDREDAALLARARLAVRDGDPAVARAVLDRLESSSLSAPRDRWLAWLLRAACATRQGDPEGAARWLEQARRAVAEQGDPGRLERREPELLALAAPGSLAPAPGALTPAPGALAPAPGALAPAPGALAAVPARDVTIVLLGRFAVERGGIDVTPPPGRPSTLVKLVALRGRLTVDEIVDELWPDADADVGRTRVRNVLSRIRAACGEVVVREDACLALAADVTVDARRFEVESGSALAAPPAARVGLARAALARVTGELLPGDRYADWASVPRERLTRQWLALLDLVANDALARGDLEEACHLLDAAIAVDPLDEERHVRLGRALLRQGRTGAARRVAAQALRVCAELGVEPGEALRGLDRELMRQA